MNKEKKEIKALTGIRAFAALWVVLFHLRRELRLLFPDHVPVVDFVLSSGYMGVDLFFILSGFIIAYNYGDWFGGFSLPRFGRFLWARLARIYPVHLFTLLLLFCHVAAREGAGLDLRKPWLYETGNLVDNLLLIQGWALPIEETWNFPSWSISAEWGAYLAFPAVFALAGLARGRLAATLTVVALAGMIGGTYALVDFNGSRSYGLIRIAGEFAIGCVLYRLYRARVWSNAPWGGIVPGALFVVIVAGAFSEDAGVKAFAWAPLFLAPLIYGLAWEQGVLARIFSLRPMLYWGRVSYSLYMVHGVVLLVFRDFVPARNLAAGDFWMRAGAVAIVATLIALLAMSTYHLVEEPARRGLRGFWPWGAGAARPVSLRPAARQPRA